MKNMRIWSVHPKYLDSVGLVALWRETLLAKNVLLGNTKGYKHHPQLTRFLKLENPVFAVNRYLSFVYEESLRRGYHFDISKVGECPENIQIPLTLGQLEYETMHLRKKLCGRSPQIAALWENEKNFEPHPIFVVRPGEVEEWEIV